MLEALPEKTAHLWLIHEDAPPAPLPELLALLCPEELTRYQRFHFAADRHRFALAHGALRLLLSRYVPDPPASWRFTQNPNGKPSLPNTPSRWLSFNLSHTRGIIALLFAANRAVGVDVEALRTTASYPAIARRHFAPPEYHHLASLPEDAQPRQFLRYWSLKESYLKARGLGLSLPLDQFWFHFPAPDLPVLETSPALQDDPERWACWLSWPTPRHALAACVERAPGERLVLVTRWMRDPPLTP